MSIVRRIGAHSAAKIAGIAYGLMGLIFGAFASIISLIGASTGQASGIQGLLFGMGAIVLLPILYGVLGYIMTIIMVAIFNVVADWTGGLEIDIEISEPSV